LASKNTNPLASLARVFSPLTYPFYTFGQLFSDLASRIQDWRVKIQTHSPVWRGFFHSHDPFYIFGQLFSDLASENTERLASMVSVLKNVFTPLLAA
jgi:hypothetical protein